MNLDFSNWEEFLFDEIFDIKKGFYNKKPEHFEEGYIRFLGATDKNNGITEYYSLDEIKLPQLLQRISNITYFLSIFIVAYNYFRITLIMKSINIGIPIIIVIIYL